MVGAAVPQRLRCGRGTVSEFSEFCAEMTWVTDAAASPPRAASLGVRESQEYDVSIAGWSALRRGMLSIERGPLSLEAPRPR